MSRLRHFTLPNTDEAAIRTLSEQLGYSTSEPKRLEDAVLRLSDHYIQNPTAATPWHETWAQAAYIAYYFPLNSARARAAIEAGARRGFFKGLESFVDFGTGLGSARFGLEEFAGGDLKQGLGVDISDIPLRLQERLSTARDNSLGSLGTTTRLPTRLSTRLVESALPPASSRLASFSYVFTELDRLPLWAEASEAILVIEPSTREDGRRLLDLRAKLIASGFYAWAPCTHQGVCPLLTQSQKDWCHDRIEWHPPDWWLELEARLPIKNRTLTFSYLLARKTAPAPLPSGTARIVGDPLEEKGKTRQLICRGSEREFLAWFPQRMKGTPELARGELVALEPTLERKANEIRVRSVDDLRQV